MHNLSITAKHAMYFPLNLSNDGEIGTVIIIRVKDVWPDLDFPFMWGFPRPGLHLSLSIIKQDKSEGLIAATRVTLKFDGWPWKIIGHLLYTKSSVVHDFKSIRGFKQELQSRNAQFRSKSAIFDPMWHWNLMDDLEKNRALLLCYVKLCASFQSHH